MILFKLRILTQSQHFHFPASALSFFFCSLKHDSMSDLKKFVFSERKKALDVASHCGLGILEEETELEGYRIYVVEQWICDRKTHSNTVKVFTGDKSHKIKVCVIGITTADLQHARPDVKRLFSNSTPLKYKSTSKGQILLTDPSELPYDMDMVLIPDGDYDRWIRQACVNINLRRTNCTGRSAFNLRKPNPASEEKFRSLYKIADAVDFEDAVINLVTLAQTALYLFNLLRRDCVDGLICDETNAAFGEFYRKYQPYKGSTVTLKQQVALYDPTVLLEGALDGATPFDISNHKTIKDPFADWDEFAMDIGTYQQIKGLRQTKVIDLDTLKKLDEYHMGPLRVRKAIKSKLDDISGINNYPLFGEDYNPEVFRDHATIDSLRGIWRPRLKNNIGSDSDKQPHELLHIIKEVSARTTKTSGAAAEILSKVAGSLSWGSNNSPGDKNASSTPKNNSNQGNSGSGNNNHGDLNGNTLHNIATGVYTSAPIVQSPYSDIDGTSPFTNGGNTSGISGSTGATDDLVIGRSAKHAHRQSLSVGRIETDNGYSDTRNTGKAMEILPQPNEPETQQNSAKTNNDKDLLEHSRLATPSHTKDNYDQHILISPSPSPEPHSNITGTGSAQATTSIPPVNEARQPQKMDDMNPGQIGGGDFVKYEEPRLPVRLERSRSVDENSMLSFRLHGARNNYVSFKDNSTIRSDLAQYDSGDDQDSDFWYDEDDGDSHSPIVEEDDQLSTFSAPDYNKILFRRPKSISAISQLQQSRSSEQPKRQGRMGLEGRLDDIPLTSHMDVETYLLYERLRQQHSELECKYQQLQSLSKGYEDMAKQLRTTYTRRLTEFEQIERHFKLIVDDQVDMEKQLKRVEDDSAKLHYELNVLNDNLIEREENVAGFYNKLEMLEKRMRDDQQSLTTFFIMGNFFKYYWQKMTGFIGWTQD
ncbi:hypothetical protein [Absidia glauca]|uniref:STB6-like N-terminal domain-containing protein n=1 Tax=Absidia glauca TaxID=4829 RepID=A0A168RGP7_ABSGL|nr:hypothetical protein [Absidia glauca]